MSDFDLLSRLFQASILNSKLKLKYLKNNKFEMKKRIREKEELYTLILNKKQRIMGKVLTPNPKLVFLNDDNISNQNIKSIFHVTDLDDIECDKEINFGDIICLNNKLSNLKLFKFVDENDNLVMSNRIDSLPAKYGTTVPYEISQHSNDIIDYYRHLQQSCYITAYELPHWDITFEEYTTESNPEYLYEFSYDNNEHIWDLWEIENKVKNSRRWKLNKKDSVLSEDEFTDYETDDYESNDE